MYLAKIKLITCDFRKSQQRLKDPIIIIIFIIIINSFRFDKYKNLQ